MKLTKTEIISIFEREIEEATVKFNENCDNNLKAIKNSNFYYGRFRSFEDALKIIKEEL